MLIWILLIVLAFLLGVCTGGSIFKKQVNFYKQRWLKTQKVLERRPVSMLLEEPSLSDRNIARGLLESKKWRLKLRKSKEFIYYDVKGPDGETINVGNVNPNSPWFETTTKNLREKADIVMKEMNT